MLGGRPPFMGTPIAVMSRHATAEPRALVAICPDMPHSISYVLSRALVKEPAERFATAGEFLAALRRASPGRSPDGPRVAVLSFVHAGGPTAVDPFSERITEEVIYALTDLGGLEVSVHSTIPLG